MTHPSEQETELIPALREPEPEPEPQPQVPRRIRWQVWGTCILLAALVIGVGLGWWFSAWYVQRNDDRWCQFYATLETSKLLATDRVLYIELNQARQASGCG